MKRQQIILSFIIHSSSCLTSACPATFPFWQTSSCPKYLFSSAARKGATMSNQSNPQAHIYSLESHESGPAPIQTDFHLSSNWMSQPQPFIWNGKWTLQDKSHSPVLLFTTLFLSHTHLCTAGRIARSKCLAQGHIGMLTRGVDLWWVWYNDWRRGRPMRTLPKTFL